MYAFHLKMSSLMPSVTIHPHCTSQILSSVDFLVPSGLPSRILDLGRAYRPSAFVCVSDVRSRRLRSSDSVTCAIRRTRTTYGDRCFAVAGPRVWNSLPSELRQSDSLGQLKRRLKTHLFGLWDHSA